MRTVNDKFLVELPPIEGVIQDIQKDSCKDVTGLIPFFRKGSLRMSLRDRVPFAALFKKERPLETTLMCGRQVSKSVSLGLMAGIFGGMIDNFPILLVEPRFEQLKRINTQIIDPLFYHSDISPYIVDKTCQNSLTMKTFKNQNEFMLCATYKSPDSARGASGVAMTLIDESQDIDSEFIPVLVSTMDANQDFGLTVYAGSAKAWDDTLGNKFETSSQGHWTIRCPHCKKYNIASPDQHLLKMIQKKGCGCYNCNKSLPVREGFWVHAFPDRLYDNAGYHVPQVVLPFHCDIPKKWHVLLKKQNEWSKSKFYNEVLGYPVDSSKHLLSIGDLAKARNGLDNSIEQAVKASKGYYILALGVDWSGGGNGYSRTSLCLAGRRYGYTGTDILYMENLEQGLSPEEEADIVANRARSFNVNFLAHDYTGAGFMREVFLYNRHPYLKSKNYPVSLNFKSTSQMVTQSSNGSRSSFVVDKTRSLLLMLMSLKKQVMTIPHFALENKEAPQQEFLNIVERDQKSDTTMNNIYTLQKVSSKFDDAAQAVNIAHVCICDRTGVYPEFALDDKYNLSKEDAYALTGDE